MLVHKKGDKQTIKNYSPVSILPIRKKTFEQRLYDKIMKLKKTFIFPNQSGFRPDDSCINQLLSINHDILSAFDIRVEVRGIFLDI